MSVERPCRAIKSDGTPCKAWAIRGTERCIYHTEKRILKEKVFTASWVIKRRLKVLDNQLTACCHVKDSVTRARLTLDIVSLMEKLEERLRLLESPKPLTLADKIAATEVKN